MASPPRRPSLQAHYRRRRLILTLATSLFLGLVGAGSGLVAAELLPFDSLASVFAPHEEAKTRHILIVGVDDSYDHQGRKLKNTTRARTDTLMLATVMPSSNRVHVLSIPRDTQVLIPRYGTEKINAAHAIGSIELTQEVVESLLDIRIDNTVTVNLSGAAQLIDTLGGVRLFVENRMKYQDRTAKLKIDLQPGWHTLDGATAIAYARYRQDALGDIGRVARQQRLLHALQQKLANPLVWWRIPQLAMDAGKLFKTDMDGDRLKDLAGHLKDKPTFSFTTLPGDFGYHGYWLPNHGRIEALMTKLKDQGKKRRTAQVPNTVEVLYVSSKEQDATRLASSLTDKGLQVIRTAEVPQQPATTRVIGRNGNPSVPRPVHDLLPHAPLQVSDDVSAYTADFTIVLGTDYQ